MKNSNFNMYVALTWWEGNNGDYKSGHFNISLYLSILELRHKT